MPVSSQTRSTLVSALASLGAAKQVISGLSSAGSFNVSNYGATGEFGVDDTDAIQKTINACSDAGGGFVVIPPGTYMIQDPTTASYGANRPGIEIPAAARNVTIIGHGATLKIGPNGCSNSAVCIYGARCRIVGLTIDVNYSGATQGTKDNTGFEINGSNDEGVQGTDNILELCKVIGGDTSNNLDPNQGAEGIKLVNATNNLLLGCHVMDCTFQAYRIAGNRNRMIGCTGVNFRGNGVRVLAGTDLYIAGCELRSDRNAGRHCIIVDPGATADSTPTEDSDVRMYRIVIRDCYLYSNTDGSQESPAVGCSVLKLASAYDVLVDGCTIIAGKASTSSPNDGLRLEDSLRRVVVRNCYIYPTVLYTPAGTSSGVFMGAIGSTVTNSGGFCQYSATNAITSTGVGKTLFVRGSSVDDYNGPQSITAVSGTTITTNREFRSASIGSNCVGHTGADEVYFYNCVIDGMHDQQVNAVWNLTSRITHFENCTFKAAEETTAKKAAINTEWTNDKFFDLFRLVNCTFIFNSDKLQKCVNPSDTNGSTLVTSGKIISYGNTYRNEYNNGSTAPGAVVLVNPYESGDVTASYDDRLILFTTDGETTTRFRSTGVNTENIVTWAVGDVIINTSPTAGGPKRWVNMTAGTSPVWTSDGGGGKTDITGNVTLTAANHGEILRATAADAVVTLPSSATIGAGVTYTFVLASAGLSGGTGLSISPNASDAIIGNGFTVADNKDAILSGATDRAGDSMTIVSDGVDGWYITAVTGTWAREA